MVRVSSLSSLGFRLGRVGITPGLRPNDFGYQHPWLDRDRLVDLVPVRAGGDQGQVVLPLAQGAMVVDLDGPLLLAEDRDHPLHYDEAGVHPPEAALWG